MIRQYDFAPLDGITKTVFRRVWNDQFGGADRFFIPFFSPTSEHVMTSRDLKELDRARNAGLELIPQVMTKRAEDFLWATEIVKDLGYTEANLNLGCPSGTVAGKGKGSGFLSKPDELEKFFDEVFSKVTLPVSVKTRLGIHDPEEFERILEIYNRYPIHCLTIHPRVQKQFYKGEVHSDAFAKALEKSKNPVCYNGDLKTVESFRSFEERFPTVEHVMVGRGAIGDPALLRKVRGTGEAATREELQHFTKTLYAAYTEFYQGQDAQAAQRMKEVWFYLIHLFVGGERIDRKLRRNRDPRIYEQLEATIFAELPLLDHLEGDLV